MFAAMRDGENRTVIKVCMALTLDVPMQLPFGVEVIKSSEEFTHDNRNVFFAEDAWFHLGKTREGCTEGER